MLCYVSMNLKAKAFIIGSTWDLAFTRNILVMSVVFMYTGIVLSFWSSVYPTCIASTLKLSTNNNNTSAEINTKGILALNAILQGIGQASGIFGILGKFFDNFIIKI